MVHLVISGDGLSAGDGGTDSSDWVSTSSCGAVACDNVVGCASCEASVDNVFVIDREELCDNGDGCDGVITCDNCGAYVDSVFEFNREELCDNGVCRDNRAVVCDSCELSVDGVFVGDRGEVCDNGVVLGDNIILDLANVVFVPDNGVVVFDNGVVLCEKTVPKFKNSDSLIVGRVVAGDNVATTIGGIVSLGSQVVGCGCGTLARDSKIVPSEGSVVA